MESPASRIRFLASREVRVIPVGGEHPVDAAGDFVPLLPEQMPDSRHGPTAIVAYETVTEGSPISSAFPNTLEGRLDLVRWRAEHCATLGQHHTGAEAWAATLFGPNTTIGPDGSTHA